MNRETKKKRKDRRKIREDNSNETRWDSREGTTRNGNADIAASKRLYALMD